MSRPVFAAITVAVGALALMAAEAPAELDGRDIDLQGKIARVHWSEGMVTYEVTVEKTLPHSEPVGRWRVEAPAPVLRRLGFDHAHSTAGLRVVLRVHRFKDEACDDGCRAQVVDMRPACDSVLASLARSAVVQECYDIETYAPHWDH